MTTALLANRLEDGGQAERVFDLARGRNIWIAEGPVPFATADSSRFVRNGVQGNEEPKTVGCHALGEFFRDAASCYVLRGNKHRLWPIRRSERSRGLGRRGLL